MKKHGKLLTGIIIAIVVILVVLGVVPYFVKLDSFIPKIETAAQSALGREVKLKSIRLMLITGPGVKLTGIEIANQPGLGSEPLVSVDSVTVKIGVLPLLANKIYVRRIALIKPRILLEKNRQGELSLSDIQKKFSGKAETAPAETSKKGFEVAGRKLEIGSLAIKNGTLAYNDNSQSPPSKIQLNDFNILVKDIGVDKPIKFDLSFCPEEACTSKDISLSGKIGPLGEDLNFKAAAIDAAGNVSSLQLAKVLPLVGSVPIQVLSGTLSGKFAIKGSQSGGEGGANLTVSDLSFTNTSKSWAPSPKIKISLDSQLKINLTDKAVEFEKGTLAIGKSVLPLAGMVKGSAYEFTISQGSLDMAEIVQIVTPLQQTLTAKGAALTGQAVLNAKFGAASPLKYDAALDMKNAGLDWPGLLNKPAGQDLALKMAGRKSESGYVIENLNMNFPGGGLNGSGELSNSNNLNLALAGNQMSLDQMAGWLPALKSLPLSGKMNLAATLFGDVTNTSAMGLKIANLTVNSPSMDMAMTGSVENFSAPKIRFESHGNNLDLDKLMAAMPKSQPATPKAQPAKPAPASVPASAAGQAGGESSLKQVDLEGRLNYGKILTSGYEFNNVSTNMTMKNGVLKIGDAKLGIFKGLVTGPVSLDLVPKTMAFDGNINLADIAIPEALKKYSSLAQTLAGNLDGSFQFKGSGSGVDEIERTLSGKGNFAIKGGSFKTMDLIGDLLGAWASSDKFRSLVQGNVGKKQWKTLNATNYDLATGNFEIQDGKVLLNNVAMNVADGKIIGQGKFGFDYSVSFEGDLVFSEKASSDLARSMGLGPDFTRYLFKDGKNLWLPFAIKGKYPQFQVMFDSEDYWKSTQKNLQKTVTNVLQGQGQGHDLQKTLQGQAQQGLQQLFGGGDKKDKKKK